MSKIKILIFAFFLLASFASLFLGTGAIHNFTPVPGNKSSDAATNSRSLPSSEQNKAIPQSEYKTNKQLQEESDALLHLFDKMPAVSVYITDEPVIKSGTSSQKAVAYTTCESPAEPIIFVKKNFYEKANKKQLVNILKHELTHAWFCRQGIKSAHDARFRKKFESIGGFGN